jgi:hypothetical protein
MPFILNKLNKKCITLVSLYWYTVMHGQQNIKLNFLSQRYFVLHIVTVCISFVEICCVVCVWLLLLSIICYCLATFMHHTFGLFCLYLTLLCTWQEIVHFCLIPHICCYIVHYVLLFDMFGILLVLFAVDLWNVKWVKQKKVELYLNSLFAETTWHITLLVSSNCIYTGWSKSLCAPDDYNTEIYK